MSSKCAQLDVKGGLILWMLLRTGAEKYENRGCPLSPCALADIPADGKLKKVNY